MQLATSLQPIHHCHAHIDLDSILCRTSLELCRDFLGIPVSKFSLKKSFAALFVLMSRGCNLSVVPAGIITTTMFSASTFSRREVVVWPLKVSIRTIAFCVGAPVSSLTFLMYGKMMFSKKRRHVSSLLAQ